MQGSTALLGWRLLQMWRGSGGVRRGPGSTSRLGLCGRQTGGSPQSAQNCRAMFSTASPKRQVWETQGPWGTKLRRRPLCWPDTARGGAPGPQVWTSHDPEYSRWYSSLGAWDFIAVWSSFRIFKSWPPSCRSLGALVWRTCSNAVACKAEEASPQATVLIARRVPTGPGRGGTVCPTRWRQY